MKKTKSNPKGAGRPKLGKVRLVAKVEPETLSTIQDIKQTTGKSLGEVLDARFK